MKTFEFTVIASGLHPEESGFEDRFFEAGCDDATIAFQKGVIILDFSREADSFAHAVASAYEDVRRAGAAIERIEPDHLVSLSDIADRAKMTRQAIALYSNGERGKDFPIPVARVMSSTPLWDWYQVAEWLHAHGRLDRSAVGEARVVREANICLESRVTGPEEFGKRLEKVAA